ncbi:MAG: ABC transporter ATP-binding protein [Nitrososphaerota archaeon]|jgi:iron complex transport system ATP-binding protein|nr:ABC transporter ATP-binding protein [Nitrososphaerota archaeon]
MSFVINEPGLTCIIGPNGVGKTTLIRSIGKLLNYQKGNVSIENKRVSEYSFRDFAKKLSYVSNDMKEVFALDVMDYVTLSIDVRYGIFTKNNSRIVAQEYINKMGLSNIIDKKTNELSTGQYKQIAIIRGLIQNTKIMIFDEPTANLDIKHQHEVMRLLKQISKDEGKSILMVCHDVNLASRFADKILMMFSPVKYKMGTASELINEENISELFDVSCNIVDVNGLPYVIFPST